MMKLKLILLSVIGVINFQTLFAQKINLIPNPINGYKKENLGDNINSTSSDGGPIISVDGRKLFYFRSKHPDNIEDQSTEDIWMSTWDGNSWTKSVNVGRPLNNKSHNGVVGLSTDGNVIFVINHYDSKGEYKQRGLSYSYKQADGTWTMPKPVVIDNYYNDESGYNNYTLSPGRRQIIMSAGRKDTRGKHDLYVSFLKKDGTYSEPTNLGDVVNSSDSDVTPFLASDGITLYFTSKGHPGYGKGDIFVTRRLDDTWKNWSKPQNLGKEINSEDFDGFFTIPASGDYAYLTSSKNTKGSDDLFRIKLPESAKPMVTAVIKGTVKLNGSAAAAELIYYDQNTKKLLGYAFANPKDGSYKIPLLAGKSYIIEAIYPGLEVAPKVANLKGVKSYKEMVINFEYNNQNTSMTFKSVLFPYNSSEITKESTHRISGIINYLYKNPNARIEVGGHTDSSGSNELNQTLSQQRAEAIKNILVESGISESRIEVKAYASSQPAASNGNESGRRLNRRVSIKILN